MGLVMLAFQMIWTVGVSNYFRVDFLFIKERPLLVLLFLLSICFVFDVFRGLPITAAFLRSKGVFMLKKVLKSGSNCSITIVEI